MSADQVRIFEVGPRDGLQNENVVIPTGAKVEFVNRLAHAGLSDIEAASFVPAALVPQLADAEAVTESLATPTNWVLTPNETALNRALVQGCSRVSLYLGATDAFTRQNLNRDLAAQMGLVQPVVQRCQELGIDVRAHLAMCWGDPFEGVVDPGAVVAMTTQLVDMGVGMVSLGDTIGVATPGDVEDMLENHLNSGVLPEQLAVHFHDTYGQALANSYAAYRAGIRSFDTSAGGLGGCPYAPSRVGNLATEDLVWMLRGMGIDTGVDLRALVTTSEWMTHVLGRPSSSRVVTAMTPRLSELSRRG